MKSILVAATWFNGRIMAAVRLKHTTQKEPAEDNSYSNVYFFTKLSNINILWAQREELKNLIGGLVLKETHQPPPSFPMLLKITMWNPSYPNHGPATEGQWQPSWNARIQVRSLNTMFPNTFLHREGPQPGISDSLFSLVIFLYVAITFLWMFYGFCWREPTPVKPPSPPPEPENANTVMSC